MSRFVQIGDYARIKINEHEYYLVITDIKPSHIVAGDHNIIPVGNRWMVQDYPVKHVVGFTMGPPLPTYPEITSQILLSLNYDDLMNACRINKDFNKVCQDDYFWKLKVEHDYGILTQYKPLDITYREQYGDLHDINTDILIRDDIPSDYTANQAAGRGRLDILKLFASYGIYPDENAILAVVENGHLEILKWLAETKGLYPDQEGADFAAIHGHLKIVKWLAQTKGLYPDQDSINLAMGDGHLEILKWLAQTKEYYPDQEGANNAANTGQLEALKWLAQTKNIYPDEEGANLAVEEKFSEVVQWLAQHGIHPD
jgi:hypothetical protein